VVGVTPADTKYTNTTPVSCTGSNVTLYAASTGAPREVTVALSPSADAGIRVAFGDTVALANTDLDAGKYTLIFPGQAYSFGGRQAITCTKAGTASVTAYLLPASYAGWVP
jgi:hypothetical protein